MDFGGTIIIEGETILNLTQLHFPVTDLIDLFHAIVHA